MRIAVAVLGLAVLAGCQNEPKDSLVVSFCEVAIKSTLRSPSTYERVEVLENENSALVTYDAANAFGTPTRGNATCAFENPADRSALELTEISINGASTETLTRTARHAVMIEKGRGVYY